MFADLAVELNDPQADDEEQVSEPEVTRPAVPNLNAVRLGTVTLYEYDAREVIHAVLTAGRACGMVFPDVSGSTAAVDRIVGYLGRPGA